MHRCYWKIFCAIVDHRHIDRAMHEGLAKQKSINAFAVRRSIYFILLSRSLHQKIFIETEIHTSISQGFLFVNGSLRGDWNQFVVKRRTTLIEVQIILLKESDGGNFHFSESRRFERINVFKSRSCSPVDLQRKTKRKHWTRRSTHLYSSIRYSGRERRRGEQKYRKRKRVVARLLLSLSETRKKRSSFDILFPSRYIV